MSCARVGVQVVMWKRGTKGATRATLNTIAAVS